MRRVCTDGLPDRAGGCGVSYDDARRSTLCPHRSLDGGDYRGVGPLAGTDPWAGARAAVAAGDEVPS